jgi:hypothetical protein
MRWPFMKQIVTAVPMKPNIGLANSLKGKAPEVYAAGDCRDPRMIVDAIADGWKICRKI